MCVQFAKLYICVRTTLVLSVLSVFADVQLQDWERYAELFHFAVGMCLSVSQKLQSLEMVAKVTVMCMWEGW